MRPPPAILLFLAVGAPARTVFDTERLDAEAAGAALAATGAVIRAKPAEAIAKNLMNLNFSSSCELVRHKLLFVNDLKIRRRLRPFLITIERGRNRRPAAARTVSAGGAAFTLLPLPKP